MTKEEKYKKELLDKYLNKNLSNDERHELEKLALDDPFLFEALNGFAQAGMNTETIEKEIDHAKDISDLRENILTGPSEKKKKRSSVPYSIAASLLIVFGLSMWLTDFGSENAGNEKSYAASSEDVKDKNKVGLAELKTAPAGREDVVVSQKEIKAKAKEMTDQIQTNANKGLSVEDDKVKPESQIEPLQKTTISSNQSTATNNSPNEDAELDMNLENESVVEDDEVSREVLENNVQVLDIASDEMLGAQKKLNEEVELIEAEPELEEVDEDEREMARVSAAPKAATSKVQTQSYQADDSNGNIGDSGLSPFDVHFIGMVKKKLKKKEQRALNENVELQFEVISSNVIDFKVVPSQGVRIDQMLFDFVQSGVKLLPEQDALLMVYSIGF